LTAPFHECGCAGKTSGGRGNRGEAMYKRGDRYGTGASRGPRSRKEVFDNMGGQEERSEVLVREGGGSGEGRGWFLKSAVADLTLGHSERKELVGQDPCRR